MKPVASPESEMWPNQHGTWKPRVFNPIRNSDGRLVIDDQNLELGRPHVTVSSRYLRSATAARFKAACSGRLAVALAQDQIDLQHIDDRLAK